ncbi:hypothetical protein J7T55_009340 [Diaporthe amygdali]|uniref:uncharacterized protein n=1 Tax=Phomopsis amygdali TaxID=1214568 RepID=UPI0022FE2732|nr:uncharacterized protein J7T55_009340 [Diaporthe amygdali]KAJ0107376.1 hypothetical protein J7T55_009340 [Diaporthe amygdali]
MANEAPEQMLDVFRAAALSVTKLYKSSMTAQAKARSDGYQECLDDLLQFLDKEHLGLGDGEGWKIRAWANERLDTTDTSPQIIESDDDAEKPEPMSSPEIHRSNSTSTSHQPTSAPRVDTQLQTEPDTPVVQEITVDEPEIVVPTQETFDFRSSHPYPQDAPSPLNLANLRLSDARGHDHSISSPNSAPPSISVSRHSSRGPRHVSSGGRNATRSANRLGHGAGTKRKVNLGEFFDLGNLGQFKDGFGGSGAKRSRHL